MNNIELEATKEHYRNNLLRGLNDVEAVDWGSEASQSARFTALGDIYASAQYNSVLDVGCGLGGFYRFLAKSPSQLNYTGLDICPEMVAAMLKSNPNANGITHNLLKTPLINKSWDLVVCSGIFNRRGSDDDNYTRQMIKNMWSITNKTLAWNMLSTKADLSGIASTTRLSDPDYWCKFAKTLSNNIELNHNYLPHDFTIIIRK